MDDLASHRRAPAADSAPQTTPLDPLFEARKPWRDIWAAGQGVGLIHDVPTVGELVERIRREYDEAVDRLQRQIGPRPGSSNHFHRQETTA